MILKSDCGLRAVEEGDLPRVLEWRNSERIRAFMYTDEIITEADHRRWFHRLSQDPERAYRIFVYQGEPAGLLYFTSIDRVSGEAVWGFYLGRSDLPRGVGSAMGWLGLELAFGALGITRVRGESFCFNEKALGLHQRLGFQREKVEAHAMKNGKREPLVVFHLSREEWERQRQSLAEHIFGVLSSNSGKGGL